MQCPLCLNNENIDTIQLKSTYKVRKQKNSLQKKYFSCKNCKLIYLDSHLRLSFEEEKNRYLLHDNNIHDEGYKNFVLDIVNFIKNNRSKISQGLDYGSGVNSIISALLKQENFNIQEYDPFFIYNDNLLKSQYDYIVCCEVIEHFYNPRHEFQKLKNLLNKKSPLVLKTDLHNPNLNFENWYYRLDPTHVVFYSHESLLWIKEHYQFDQLEKISDRSYAFWHD